MNVFKASPFILCYFGLVACGGSSTSNETPQIQTDPTPEVVSDEETASEAEENTTEGSTPDFIPSLRLLADAAGGLTVQEPSSLPIAGTAVFDGVLAFVVGTDAIYGGDVVLVADLSDDTISGAATGFENRSGATVGGTLGIQEGQIFREPRAQRGYAFTAPVNGSLQEDVRTIAIDATLFADFAGTDVAMIGGQLRGTGTTNGVSQPIAESTLLAVCVDASAGCDALFVQAPLPEDVELLSIYDGEFGSLSQSIESSPYLPDDQRTITGTANYLGYVRFVTDQFEHTLIGNLSVDADFDNATLTGTVSEVLNQDAQRLDGILVFENGRAFSANSPDPDLWGDLNGALGAGTQPAYAISADLEGYLRGEGERYLTGSINGQLTVDGQSFGLGRNSEVAAENY